MMNIYIHLLYKYISNIININLYTKLINIIGKLLMRFSQYKYFLNYCYINQCFWIVILSTLIIVTRYYR